MRNNSIILFATFLAIAGCGKPESGGDEPDPTPEQPVTTPYFKAAINDFYLQGPDDTGFSVFVETNLDDSQWTVETDVEWLQAGKSASAVTVIPSGYDPQNENGTHTYPAPRTGSVIVRAGSIYNKTFTVIQESWTFINSEYEVKMSPAGASEDVFVRNNCYDWTAASDASWITLRKYDTSTLIITTSARDADNTTKRSAIVRVQSSRDPQTFCNIIVSDADSNIGGEDYKYGDHTNWD